MNRLNNKVAIITGAAGGMGKAMAILFAQEGAKVMATDVQEDKLKAWVTDIQGQGLAVDYAAHDVTSDKDWQRVVNKTIDRYGSLNILVNNAGIYPPGATTATTSDEDWKKVIDINLTGPFLGSRLCHPHMKKAGSGSMVYISSIAGIVGGNGPAYTASKGALRLLSKDQAVEWAADNIRVNSIHPGGVNTPMTAFLATGADSEEMIKAMCPMGRMGDVMEIAYAALYFASEESSFTTGAELVIDGGLTAR